MSPLSSLPYLTERPRMACPKGKSRLQLKDEDDRDNSREERRWKKEVWTRDQHRCRWCKRKVLKTLELLPRRGDCHHLIGRADRAVRWDRRNGLLLCASCHERVTGKVDEKHIIVAEKTYTVDHVSYPNGDEPVTFKRVA